MQKAVEESSCGLISRAVLDLAYRNWEKP